MSDTTEPVPSVSIANMLNQRAAVLERMDVAIQLMAEAAELAREANIGFPTVEFSASASKYRERGLKGGGDDLKALTRHAIDMDGWRYLMSQTGLRSFMDAKAREQWDKSLEKGEFPELTAGNIEATFTQLHDSRGDMFERGVISTFRTLSWCHKTNLPQMFGRRVVMRYILYTTGGGANYQQCDRIDDLSRCFAVLDGKPEPDHRTGWYSRLSHAYIEHRSSRTETEDNYLQVRTFKNGNAHVTFKRPDLVDKMNLILAKHYPDALAAPKE